MPPVSMVPATDNDLIVLTYRSVGNNEKIIIMMTAKYFPKTTCHDVSGLVRNISNVPDLYSSAKVRMESAGIRNKNIHGANSKNLSRVA